MVRLWGQPVGVSKSWGLVGLVAIVHGITLALLNIVTMPVAGHEIIRDGAVLVLPMLTLPLATRSRHPFSLQIAAISCCALLGQVIWIIQRHGFGQDSNPSFATPIWLTAYVLVVIAVFRWPARKDHPGSVRDILEALMIGCGVLALGWVYVLGPKLTGGSNVTMQTVFDLVYFTIDVLLVIGLSQAVRRGVDPRFRTSTLLAVLAVGTITVTDFSDLVVWPTGFMSDIPVVGWSFAISLANVTAWCFARESAAPQVESTDSRRSFFWRNQLPYLALLPVGALLLRVSHDVELLRYEMGVKICALLLTATLGLRQYLALRDNEELIQNLRDAQGELSDRNSELSQTQDDLTELLGRLQEKNEELAQANQQLARLGTVDGMTGLGNHRAFHERLRLEVEAARRFGHPLSILVADIDHFRRYNDEFGHPAGDDVLRQLAKIIYDSVDLKAYPARYGGEEFAVVLPYVTTQEAISISQKVGSSLGHISSRRPLTISFGVSGTENNHSTSEVLIEDALRALEAAKSRGRNQIVLAEDLERRCLTLNLGGNDLGTFEPTEPMGLAAILSAALRSHPQALSLEPDAQLVSGLLGTLELKDLETRDHSERVMWYALRLAQSVMETDVAPMTQQEIRSLAYGALLHDIGKIGVPESILKFPAKLTEEMRNVIREHPRLGAQVVMKFPTLELALPVIRYHHERWDGTGYPHGAHRREIPLVARIFALVDALEALTSQRPYKDPKPIEEVTKTFIADSGSHFDPAIVEAYLAVPMAEWMRIRELEHHLATTVFSRPAA